MSILALLGCSSFTQEPTRFDVSQDRGLVKAVENFTSTTADAAEEPSFSSNSFLAFAQAKNYGRIIQKAERAACELADRVVDITIAADPKIAIARLEETRTLVAEKLEKAMPSAEHGLTLSEFNIRVQDAVCNKAALEIDKIVIEGNFEGEFEAIFIREAEKMVAREYFDTLENAVTALKVQYAELLDKVGEKEVEKRIHAISGGNTSSSLSLEKQKACDFLLRGISL